MKQMKYKIILYIKILHTIPKCFHYQEQYRYNIDIFIADPAEQAYVRETCCY